MRGIDSPSAQRRRRAAGAFERTPMKPMSARRPRARARIAPIAALVAALAVSAGAAACAGSAPESAPEPAGGAATTDARARLDEALRLASRLEYHAATTAFEAVRTADPDAVTTLDGLKFVVVYAEIGDLAKFEELTRWMVERHRTPEAVTDAERPVKGYLVHRTGKDPELLAHALEVTRYASENAAAQGQGVYQGFFDTSRGMAEYRVGRFAEAAASLAKTLDHESLYVRSLSLPFAAMTELARGNRTQANALLARARQEAATLPAPGTEEYGVEWTDILITRMVMEEAEAAFEAPAP
jgi:hypothetical protein